MEAHDTTVLMSVINTQQEMIRSFRRDVQIAEDSDIALRMRIELLVQDVRYYESQYYICQMLLSGHHDMITELGNGNEE